uniref:Uncharacterized protein n=1 Tax=Dendroctonus ponderosae TaxID=77166 RepID=A0AAR5QKC8_DENPD
MRRISKNANIDLRNFDNATPLHLAAGKKKNGDAVALLLEQGAAVDLVTYNGDLPLHTAAASGKEQTVRLLYRKGNTKTTSKVLVLKALPDVASARSPIIKIPINQYGKMDINDIRISPLLSVADSPDLVVYLLSRGAHIKIRNNLGETLLHLAVQARNTELVNFYLEYGLSANDKTLRGDTPLTYAVQSGFVEIMDLLLEYGADYKTTNPFNKNLVHLALAKNQREACRRLVTLDINLNQLDRNGISPLHSAAGRNYCDIIKILIENNANIDIRKNATPLHMAADREECGDAVAVLLEQGAAVDVVTYNGDLPLHKAAASGNKQAVKLLHRKDFQIRKNRCGPTPLMMAEAFAKTINGVLN